MKWQEGKVTVDKAFATNYDLDALTKWAETYNLRSSGEGQVITFTGDIRSAVENLIRKEIGEQGYFVYVVNKKGKGKVVHSLRDFKLEETERIVKVPQVSGG